MTAYKQPFPYYVVLDFEATCDVASQMPVQEVIEFPSVLLRSSDMAVLDEFQSFVCPQHYPRLTAFCSELTGIAQSDVDAAPTFAEVFALHTEWIHSHGMAIDSPRGELQFAFVLCGDWDLGNMFPAQCRACVPPIETIPSAYRQWVNIKRPFAAWRGVPKAPGMDGMLRELQLDLVGRHHRGIDDCRNIARIASRLCELCQTLDITTRLAPSRYPPLRLVLVHDGDLRRIELTNRTVGALFGAAIGQFRRQAVDIRTMDGEPIEADEQLLGMAQESELAVRLR